MLRLLRQQLSEMDNHEPEILIFALLALSRNDLEDRDLTSGEHVLFDSHFPDAGWLSVYGRTTGNPVHTQPLRVLLDRVGGITKVKYPGLAFALSLWVPPEFLDHT
jgi:hypothetical protein